MRRFRALVAPGVILGLASVAVAQPAAPPAPAAPPPAPAASTAPEPQPPPSPPAPAAPRAPRPTSGLANAAEVRRGIVRLERGGRLIGMGAVLRSDGRILTALSAVGHGNHVEARFSDGNVLGVRVVSSDRAWDLALLAPEGGRWTVGLRPSVLDPLAAGGALRWFRARGGRLEEAEVSVSAREAPLGRDGVTLDGALSLSPRVNEDELGSPLFDERGEVAAIVVQACAPASARSCQLTPVGAPVSALKQFLRKAPAREPLPAAWLGFRGVAAHEGSFAGVRVVAVDAGGPAAQAGLRAGPTRPSGASDSSADVVVAVEDEPVTTPDEMKDAINRFALAPRKSNTATDAQERRVRLLVIGAGKFREVSVPLRAPRQLPEPEAAPPAALTAP